MLRTFTRLKFIQELYRLKREEGGERRGREPGSKGKGGRKATGSGSRGSGKRDFRVVETGNDKEKMPFFEMTSHFKISEIFK